MTEIQRKRISILNKKERYIIEYKENYDYNLRSFKKSDQRGDWKEKNQYI